MPQTTQMKKQVVDQSAEPGVGHANDLRQPEQGPKELESLAVAGQHKSAAPTAPPAESRPPGPARQIRIWPSGPEPLRRGAWRWS